MMTRSKPGSRAVRLIPVVPHVSSECSSFPKQLGASSLFSTVRKGNQKLQGTENGKVTIINFSKNCKIQHAGMTLDAGHQDVMLFIFKLAEGRLPIGNYIKLEWSYTHALQFLGKSYTATNRQWLRDILHDLAMHLVDCKDTETRKTVFSGPLIFLSDAASAGANHSQQCRLQVSLSKSILSLYHLGYGKVDMAKRKGLGSGQLARLLQVELACQPEYHLPFFLSTFHRLFGSTDTLSGFKAQFKMALNRLQEANIIFSWCYELSNRGLSDPMVKITNQPRPQRKSNNK
jgi:hypothetical protein